MEDRSDKHSSSTELFKVQEPSAVRVSPPFMPSGFILHPTEDSHVYVLCRLLVVSNEHRVGAVLGRPCTGVLALTAR